MVATRKPGHVMFGMEVDSMSVDSYQDVHRFSFAGGEQRAVLGLREISASFSLIGGPSEFPHDLMGQSLLGLGDGKVCPYCGTYWPTGNYMCWNCGGELATLPLVKPVFLGGMVTSVNLMMPVSGIMMANIKIDMIDPAGASSIMEFKNVHFRRMAFTERVQFGYYLCEWCGLAVEDGKPCYGCGGPRTPLRELIDMHHECVWCGNDTINGIMCQQCGTRVGGTTIKEWMDGQQG